MLRDKQMSCATNEVKNEVKVAFTNEVNAAEKAAPVLFVRW